MWKPCFGFTFDLRFRLVRLYLVCCVYVVLHSCITCLYIYIDQMRFALWLYLLVWDITKCNECPPWTFTVLVQLCLMGNFIMSICYSLLHFGSSGHSLHLALLCFVWNIFSPPSTSLFGIHRSTMVASFRSFLWCRDPVSTSNIDHNQSAAVPTSNIRASVSSQLRILPCIRLVSPLHWWILGSTNGRSLQHVSHELT
jgi:hypothetical protein